MRWTNVAVTILRMLLSVKEEQPEDAKKSVAEYVLSYGYEFQEHKVVSQDGYVITLWRVPGVRGSQLKRGRPVLIQHGILDNGFSFLFQQIHKNLPVMLLESAGLDIWIANSRGTIRSLEHVDKENYNWKKVGGKFWDFSWDEMGRYDLPAIIDYIVEETGYTKLKYICHSQGCTMLFLLSCLNLEYVNRHIEQATTFAPAMYFSMHDSTLIDLLVKKLRLFDVMETARLKNGLAHPYVQEFSKYLGNVSPQAWLACLNELCGKTDVELIDMQRVAVLAANELGGTSLQNIQHWTQELNNDTFRMYDFGKSQNLHKYGQEYPPVYDIARLKQIAFPLLVFAFENDSLVPPRAVQRFLQDLLEGTYIYEVVPNANHVSGYWGDIAYTTVFPKILSFFSQR